MSDSEILLKAAINRITARLKERFIDSAQELMDIAEEIPQKFKDEWSSFKDEVIEESERLEQQRKQTDSSKENNTMKKSNEADLIQLQIDNLRSKVIEINKSFEVKN